jgi:hypothetical protein
MDELARLIEQSRQIPAAAAFVVDPEADPVRQLVGVVAVFAGEREDAIVLYRGSERAGTIERRAVLGLFEDLQMRPGVGQHFVLPGDPQDAFLELECTEPGCDQRIYVTFFDPDEPPECPDHPGFAAEPVE